MGKIEFGSGLLDTRVSPLFPYTPRMTGLSFRESSTSTRRSLLATLVLKYSSILDWTSSPNAATARHELSAPQIRSARTLFRGAVKKVIKDFSTSLLSHWCRKAASPVDGRLSSSLRTGWCHTLHQYAGYFYPTFVLVSRGVRGCLRPSLPAGRLISATKFCRTPKCGSAHHVQAHWLQESVGLRS